MTALSIVVWFNRAFQNIGLRSCSSHSGRRTFVGDCLWSQPYCSDDAKIAEALFDGNLDAGIARTFVLGTHARFVLADCDAQVDLTKVLGPVVRSVRRFGCAAVYAVE